MERTKRKVNKDYKPIKWFGFKKDNLTDMMRDMYAKFENLNLLGNSIAFDKHLKTYKMLQNVDFSRLLGISEQLKVISSVDISGMTTALHQFVDNEFLRELKSSSIVSGGYDLQKLANIMQNSLEQVNWSQDVSVGVITEEIAEQYMVQEVDDNAEKRNQLIKLS